MKNKEMQVLVISDSHGRNQNIEKVIRRTWPIDMMLHLGDLEGSEGWMDASVACPVEMICGNNDFFSTLPRERILTIGRNKIFMTHGHRYEVSYGYELLAAAAKQRGCNIALFGHIHRPVLEYVDGITVANPGSISMPRQENKRPSYMLMDIDRHGDAHFSVAYL